MKIILSPNEKADIENLSASGARGYEVLKKIFKTELNDLKSVMNIDPKANVGLQTCARQLAYEYLLDIAEIIFLDESEDIKAGKKSGTGDKPISQWR